MEIFPVFAFVFFLVATLGQTGGVGGNSIGNAGGIFESDSTSTTTTTTERPIRAMTCPSKSAITPCTCSLQLQLVDINCGSSVNQWSIDNTFEEIRRVNEVPEGRGFQMFRFTLEDSGLTELDLAPFYGNQIDTLDIKYNPRLTKLVTSGNPQNYGSIRADIFSLSYSPLVNRSGYGDVLKYFSNDMESLYARDLSLYAEDISDEFLPGLSALTNLEKVFLYNCNISGRLDSDSWIFRELKGPNDITLLDNKISEIGENVFDFYGVGDYGYVYINLWGNKLNESSFHPNSGLARAGRKTQLVLRENRITTLPAQIFEPFLDAHPQNSLLVEENPLICDERLSWLKSRRDELKSRVSDAQCANDRDHTIFDSDLIP